MPLSAAVEPPLSGHHREQEKCPLNRGVLLIEVIITKINKHFASRDQQNCPLNRGVLLKGHFHTEKMKLCLLNFHVIHL